MHERKRDIDMYRHRERGREMERNHEHERGNLYEGYLLCHRMQSTT